MEQVMVCLVGEQPLPNLLPVRYFKPQHVVLASSKDTDKWSQQLDRVLQDECVSHRLDNLLAFNIPAVRTQLERCLKERGWQPAQVIFNLTGGTKAMAFAAYSLAAEWGSRFIYFESDETLSRVYRYKFNQKGQIVAEGEEDLPGLINLDEYLQVHIDEYEEGAFPNDDGGKFEEAIYEALKQAGQVSEVKHSIRKGDLEIDLAVRCGNRVGIAEVKTGDQSTKKSGLDQLNTAVRREFLGIYTRKFLIVTKKWADSATLWPLVESSGIQIIELPGYEKGKRNLPERERERLTREITENLGQG